MITAYDILEALEKNPLEVRNKLGADWSTFHQEVAPLLKDFSDVTDRNELEIAVEPVWQLCYRYPSVKEMIQKRATERQVLSAGENIPDEIPIREIANRFQSLLDKFQDLQEPETAQKPYRNIGSESTTANENS